MTFQYALRFESGERRGEVVPVAIVGAQGGAFTIGRKPGNSLQVTDASVSGSHAEIELAGEALSIRDLESTNGTEIGGRRIRQAELRHGDQFALGKVQFAVLDRSRDDGGDAGPALELEGDVTDDPVGLSRTRIQPREEGFEITADDLARSRKSSKLAPVLLLLLAILAGGAWWWTSQHAAEEEGSKPSTANVIQAPAGHLLSGYSFEDTKGWLFEEAEGTAFTRSGLAKASGRRGARVELVGGSDSILASERVSLRGAVVASAAMRAEASLEGHLGLRFHGGEDRPDLEVWSDAARAGDDFGTVSVAGSPPPGYPEVSVLLRARNTAPEPDEDSEDPPYAALDVDDVSLVAEDSASPIHTLNSWTVLSTGRVDGSHRAFAVSSLDRTVLPSISVLGDGGAAVDVSASVDGDHVILRPAAAGTLQLVAQADLAAGGLASISGLGDPSYAGHGTSFDVQRATSIMVGKDASLVRFAFPSARAVVARPSGSDVAVRFDVAAGDQIRLQVEFGEERTLAQRLARRAGEERSAGRDGDALRTWSELLQEVPFDTALVTRGAAAQSEIVAAGREDLKALAAEVERARFFGLEPLFLEKLARAEAIVERYRGSEVETLGSELVATIQAELVKLGGDKAASEGARLQGIAEALREAGSVGLASRVDTYRQRDSAGGR